MYEAIPGTESRLSAITMHYENSLAPQNHIYSNSNLTDRMLDFMKN